jgi:hypothetical protein
LGDCLAAESAELLSAIARPTQHAGQVTLSISSMA